MYTIMYNNPDPLASALTDGNTYVNAGELVIFTELMAGLVAHEEVHHAGQDNPSDDFATAYPTQYTCVLG